MKKSRSFLAVLIVSLSYVLSPVTAKAEMWDVPVAPGESFRWVFVTSGRTAATSSEISYYNEFVNHAADIVATPITGVLGKSTIADIEWKAIATAGTVGARDNIGESTAPIYDPGSLLVATGIVDLFDGWIVNPIGRTETGTPYDGEVWTGSRYDGVVRSEDCALGSRTPIIGMNTYVDDDWLYWGFMYNTAKRPLYAISEELTVVPVPSALILGATGLLSSTLGLIRLRRKHQEPSQI